MLMYLKMLHTVPFSWTQPCKPAGLSCSHCICDEMISSVPWVLRCFPGPAGICGTRRWQHACCTFRGSHLLAGPAAAADAAVARRPAAGPTIAAAAAAAAGNATAAARHAIPACAARRPHQDMQAWPYHASVRTWNPSAKLLIQDALKARYIWSGMRLLVSHTSHRLSLPHLGSQH